MELGDVIPTASLLAAVVGLLFTADQIRRNTRAQRGTFYKQLYETFFLNEGMFTVFDLMERGQWSFDEHFGAKDDGESYRRSRALEQLLAHLEVICFLYRRRLITFEDLQEFEYNIQRLVKYEGFFGYLDDHLEDFRAKGGLLRAPYGNLRWYVHSNRARLERHYPESTEPRIAAPG